MSCAHTIQKAPAYMPVKGGGMDANGGFATIYIGRKKYPARMIAAFPAVLEALQDIVEQYEASRLSVGADLADSIRVFGKQALAKALDSAP